MALTILKHTTHIDFVGVRRYAYAFSTIVILLGLVAIFMNGGLRYGVDFAGGVMVQIQFSKPVADEEVKKAVADIDMPGLTVQQVGNDSLNYLLRFSVSKEGATENLRNDVNDALSLSMPDNPATIERLEMVGPKVGGELRNMAVEALFYSVLLITVYISGRFEYSWILAGIMAVLMWGVVYGSGWLAELIGWTGYNRLWGVAVAGHHRLSDLEIQAQFCTRGHHIAAARRVHHTRAAHAARAGNRPQHHRRAAHPCGLFPQ